MRVEREAHLPLEDTVDQQAQHRQPRSRRDPCGLLQPHGSDGSRILEPAKTRFHGGILVLIGLENLPIRTALLAYRRSQDRPPIVLFRIGQGLNLNRQAIARLERRWGPLRWPASTGPARAAGVCYEAIADRVIPPGTWTAPAAARPPAFIRCQGRVGVGEAGKPPG